jgi:hypothetical protein
MYLAHIPNERICEQNTQDSFGFGQKQLKWNWIKLSFNVWFCLFASVKTFTCLQQNWSGWCNVQKFAAINGILFPGGATSLDDNPFYQTAEKLFKVMYKTCSPSTFERSSFLSLYIGINEKWWQIIFFKRHMLLISLHQMVIKANDNGDYFPLYGACLGFQVLTVIVSQVLLS